MSIRQEACEVYELSGGVRVYHIPGTCFFVVQIVAKEGEWETEILARVRKTLCLASGAAFLHSVEPRPGAENPEWLVVGQVQEGNDPRRILLAPPDRPDDQGAILSPTSDEPKVAENPMPHCAPPDGSVGGGDGGKAPDPDGDSCRFASPTVTTTYGEDEQPLGAY